MREDELATSVLRHVLALRQFRVFESVALEEIATLAENVDEVELAPGTIVAAVGERPAVHFLLEGELASSSSRARWTPRDVFGAVELLADRPARESVAATSQARTLRLEPDALEDLLDDNFGLLRAALREASRLVATHPRKQASAPRERSGRELGLVDRLLLLRAQIPFAHARLTPLAALAAASRELMLPPGSSLALAEDAYIVVDGELRDGVRELRAGDAIGLMHVLGARVSSGTVETVTPVRALAIGGAELHDVLEDHADFGFDVLAALCRELIDR